MKQFTKDVYNKKITLRQGDNQGLFDLYVNDVWVNSSNSVDNIRGELFEVLLNSLYSVSLGYVVTKLEIIECYYKTELFIACFNQELEEE